VDIEAILEEAGFASAGRFFLQVSLVRNQPAVFHGEQHTVSREAATQEHAPFHGNIRGRARSSPWDL
jgi:hypothetical protein